MANATINVNTSYGKRSPIRTIVLSAGGAIAGLYVIDLIRSYSASDKLDIDLDKFNLQQVLKAGKIPVGVLYRATLKINNPTSIPITITPPYVKIMIQDQDGKLARLANSNPSPNNITIGARGTTYMNVDLEIRALNVIGLLPDLITYVLARINGEPSTRKVTVVYDYSYSGLTLSDRKEVAL